MRKEKMSKNIGVCGPLHFLASVLILERGMFHPAIFPRVGELFQALPLCPSESQRDRFSKFFLTVINSAVLREPGHQFQWSTNAVKKKKFPHF